MTDSNQDVFGAQLRLLMQSGAARKLARERGAGYENSEFGVGDHLIVSRGLYSHHGIYAGHGQVIHYSGLSKGLERGPVIRDTIAIFSQGQDVVIRKYSDAKFTGPEVVRRAESRLGEDLYDVHSNNCEDFCNWAVTGSHGSFQVDFSEVALGYFAPTTSAAMQARKHLSRVNAGDSSVGSLAAHAAGTAVAMAAMPAIAPLFAVRGLVKFFSK